MASHTSAFGHPPGVAIIEYLSLVRLISAWLGLRLRATLHGIKRADDLRNEVVFKHNSVSGIGVALLRIEKMYEHTGAPPAIYGDSEILNI